MGPKRNVAAEKDKTQSTDAAVDVESDTEDEDLRHTIQRLEEQLKLANEERYKEKNRATARERELEALSNIMRRNEQAAAAERDTIVRDLQGRIHELTALSETQSNRAQSPPVQRPQDQGGTQQIRTQAQVNVTQGDNNGNQGRVRGHPNYDVPMPRQALFDGKTTWESFFQPFEALAVACKWDQNEKLFRLTSCLRGEAAEYAFGQLPQDTLGDFSQLERALEARYKEKRTLQSWKISVCKQKKNWLIMLLI